MEITTKNLFALLNSYYEMLTILTSNPAASPYEVEFFFWGYVYVERELTRRGMHVPVKFIVD